MKVFVIETAYNDYLVLGLNKHDAYNIFTKEHPNWNIIKITESNERIFYLNTQDG